MRIRGIQDLVRQEFSRAAYRLVARLVPRRMAGLAVGSAQRALDASVAYAASATQGGTPIRSFQLLQAVIAHQQTGVLTGRAVAREAGDPMLVQQMCPA